jgi:hypothetical protein
MGENSGSALSKLLNACKIHVQLVTLPSYKRDTMIMMVAIIGINGKKSFGFPALRGPLKRSPGKSAWPTLEPI